MPAHGVSRVTPPAASLASGEEQSLRVRAPFPRDPPQQVNTTLGISSGHRSLARRCPAVIAGGFISQIINQIGQGPYCLLWVAKKGRRGKSPR